MYSSDRFRALLTQIYMIYVAMASSNMNIAFLQFVIAETKWSRSSHTIANFPICTDRHLAVLNDFLQIRMEKMIWQWNIRSISELLNFSWAEGGSQKPFRVNCCRSLAAFWLLKQPWPIKQAHLCRLPIRWWKHWMILSPSCGLKLWEGSTSPIHGLQVVAVNYAWVKQGISYHHCSYSLVWEWRRTNKWSTTRFNLRVS